MIRKYLLYVLISFFSCYASIVCATTTYHCGQINISYNQGWKVKVPTTTGDIECPEGHEGSCFSTITGNPSGSVGHFVYGGATGGTIRCDWGDNSKSNYASIYIKTGKSSCKQQGSNFVC